MPSTFGLIDGNAFYCSCERAFSPRLRGRAVVVLSNNDGLLHRAHGGGQGGRAEDGRPLVQGQESARSPCRQGGMVLVELCPLW